MTGNVAVSICDACARLTFVRDGLLDDHQRSMTIIKLVPSDVGPGYRPIEIRRLCPGSGQPARRERSDLDVGLTYARNIYGGGTI